MHSSEGSPGQTARTTGADLLLQLGRLIIRSRSGGVQPECHTPSTSEIKTQPQPKSDDEMDLILEEQLNRHVNALWTEQIPVCIDVLLAPECAECHKGLTRVDSDSAFDKQHAHHRGLLLERWTLHAALNKGQESPMFMNPQWLVNAVRSQLHFSQLSAWRARIHTRDELEPLRRKLSREQCNYKKIEANTEPNDKNERKLHVVYSIKIPGESYNMSEFSKQTTDHIFPITEIGNNVFLKLVLQSLPRLDDIPLVKCVCQKRRLSKDMSNNISNLSNDLININDDLVGRLNDLSIGSKNFDGAIEVPPHRLSIINNKEEKNVVDDRMLTPCSENGKHKCSCDDESDSKEKNAAKKLDERRLKEIAKYKRRLRKEKMRKLCESTSSEGENLKTKETTSIPILQASRFDRFRAIGCYRNQTYLTLPTTRIETKSPFTDSETIPPPEFKKTNTIATQTDFTCSCGSVLEIKCEECNRGMVRSDANYNLAGMSEQNKQENGARRKLDDGDEDKTLKKPKCDNFSVNCDNVVNNDLIKRPKFKRFFPIVDRLEKIVNDRNDTDTNDTNNDSNDTKDSDIKDLHLNTDDSVFSVPKDSKRQKTYSIGDDGYVLFEKCDYGTIDKHDSLDSPKELTTDFKFAMPVNNNPYDNGQNLECYKNDFIFNAPKKNETYDRHPKCHDSKKSDNSGNDQNLQYLKHVYYPNRNDTYVRGQNSSDTHDTDQNIKPDYYDKHQNLQYLKHVYYPNRNYLSQNINYTDKVNNETYKDENVEYQNDKGQDLTDNSDKDENLDGQNDKQTLDYLKMFTDPKKDGQVPSPSEMDRFRWTFDSAASMVFHTKTGLPLTSSPAPLRRGNNCFDFDDSINGISGIKSALFHPITPVAAEPSPISPPRPKRVGRLKLGPSSGLLGSFEESALQGRLEAVATVAGFTAELGASGAFCPPHRRLPVTVFFYAPGGTNAPYMGHINLGSHGYRVSRSGTIQVSLFNPHGTLVKMFVVLYDLTRMPPRARTFLRQRTLYMPAGADPPQPHHTHKWLRYLIHLRFMTSKSGKLYLHTDIRLIVSRKADLDTATAHSALFRPIQNKNDQEKDKVAQENDQSAQKNDQGAQENGQNAQKSDQVAQNSQNRSPNRVFGGCSDQDSEFFENQTGVPYELRSFTYAPENPRFSPR